MSFINTPCSLFSLKVSVTRENIIHNCFIEICIGTYVKSDTSRIGQVQRKPFGKVQAKIVVILLVAHVSTFSPLYIHMSVNVSA